MSELSVDQAKAESRAGVDEAYDRLTKRQKTLVSDLSAKSLRDCPPVKFKAEALEGGGVELTSNMADATFDGLVLTELLGTRSEALAGRLVDQIRDASSEVKNASSQAAGLTAGLGFVQGVAPQNEVEGTLAVQMFAVHNLMMSAARRAETAQYLDAGKMWLDQVNKLGRTFTGQVEALAKLRNGGKQTVEVKYVDARNSQNIIADTVTTGGGGAMGSLAQPVAQALAHQPGASCPPVRSEIEAHGLPLPGTSDQGQAEMSDARG